MTRSSRLLMSALTIVALSTPASAQFGGVGGAIGGVVGGVTNTVGGGAGTASGTVGGVLSSGGAGGSGGSLGGFGIGGSLSGRLSGVELGGSGGGLSSPGGGGGLSSLGAGGSFSRLLSASRYSIATGVTNNQLADELLSLTNLDRVTSVAMSGLSNLTPEQEADLRLLRLQALVAANRATLDQDVRGYPVRTADLVVMNPDPVSLSAAIRSGFPVVGREQIPALGIQLIMLGVPRGMNVRQAMKRLNKVAPALQVDFDHVYEPAGGALLPAAGAALAASAPRRGRLRIAMIDGGVAAHPSLARASIEQRGFAGGPQPTGHGTAVGSLLVGDQGPFRGAARGAQLFVADVYGGDPAAGSVSNIVRALGWAASKRPSVINVSLVGPDNRILSQAIAALRARGMAVTAAVGNDGPAAPPQYPASYAGVVAVTGVDARGHALAEAGKAVHLDFAAPGADMAAALPGRGYTQVRGTSFAAPLAAARLALTGSYQRLAAEAVPGKGHVGRGIVCVQCRIDPRVFRSR